MSRGLISRLFRREATLEDSADRLSHVWTFGLLMLLAILVAWRQETYSPIECWPPAYWTDQQIQTADSICWNSYLIHYPRKENSNENFSADTFLQKYQIPIVSRRKYAKSFLELDFDANHTYYQWIPLILALQALLFKLPDFLFHVLHGYCGITFQKIASLTNGYQALATMEDRRRLSQDIAAYIQNWCTLAMSRWCFTGLHIFIKILYCINIITQLALFNDFLLFQKDKIGSYASKIFGWDLSWNGTSVYHSARFAPTVFCNLEIPALGKIHEYTILCDLPSNIFNDKVFKFIWIWLVFVCVMTIGSSCIRIVQAVFPYFRKKYVQTFLLKSFWCEPSHRIQADDIMRFTEAMLGEDGVMVLRLVGDNSSDLLVSDVVGIMYEKWSQSGSKEKTSVGGKGLHLEMLVTETSA